jgi:tetratricopeptide (TPR) repeat protein
MTLEPPRRAYKDHPGKRGRLKDVDARAQGEKFRILIWALAAGLPMGGLAGWALGRELLGAILGPLIIYGVAVLVLEGSGRAASLLFLSSGSSTPKGPGYSRAEALAARGDYQGAIVAYQAAILEAPEHAEPYVKIARIHRDRLDDQPGALEWFRRAVEESSIGSGMEMLVRREMAELLIHRLGQPRKAAPDLARLAEARAGTPDGDWAEKELSRIKKLMAQEEDSS